MIKALLLDCDGVVVKSDRVSNRYSEESGIPLEVFNEFFNNEFQQCIVGRADLKTEIAKYLPKWNWNKTPEEFLAYWFDDQYNRPDLRFVPILEALRKRGIKIYMATDNERYRTDDLVKNKGLGKWFDGVYSSGYIGLKKSDPAFYAHVLKDIGLPAEEVFFWDDDMKNIAVAQASGILSMYYKSLDQFTDEVKTLS